MAPGDGTFYLRVPVPQGRTSLSFAEYLLDEASVLVTLGTAYGRQGECYVRTWLTVPDGLLEQTLDSMRTEAARGR